MATVGQVYYNVMNNNSGGYESSSANLNIFSDLVSAYGAKQFNKIGIQAPPGTKVVMNTNKTIMVGRTGIYELDDDIVITNLYFVRPRRYMKDEDASAAAIAAGTKGMLDADAARSAALAQLNKDFPVIPTEESNPNYKIYWDRYNVIQTTYIEAYQEALGQFNTGVNGIYILPNPSNPEAEENFQDLYNVILDFIYE